MGVHHLEYCKSYCKDLSRIPSSAWISGFDNAGLCSESGGATMLNKGFGISCHIQLCLVCIGCIVCIVCNVCMGCPDHQLRNGHL